MFQHRTEKSAPGLEYFIQAREFESLVYTNSTNKMQVYYFNVLFVMRTGLEPVTSAVIADMGFEPIREVLNIHLARLLASRLSTIRQSASDLFQVYSCIQGSILTN